jgi:hypothetical protein
MTFEVTITIKRTVETLDELAAIVASTNGVRNVPSASVIDAEPTQPAPAPAARRAKKEPTPPAAEPVGPVSAAVLTALRAKAAEKIAADAANRPLVHAIIAKFSDANAPKMSAIPADKAQEALDAMEAL